MPSGSRPGRWHRHTTMPWSPSPRPGGVDARLVVDEVRFDPGMTRIRTGELVGVTARSAAVGPGLHWVRLADAPPVTTALLLREQGWRPAVHQVVAAARDCRERHGWTTPS